MTKHTLKRGLTVELSEPVVIAKHPGPSEWGVHQFPALNRRPDGSILIMYSDAPDQFTSHGVKAPGFVSRDQGVSWTPYAESPEIVRPHFCISELYDGEYLVIRARPYLDRREQNIVLPEPLSVVDIYGPRYYYALEDLPEKLQSYFGTLPALRYDPKTESWNEQEVRLDNEGRIIVRYEAGDGGDLLPQTFFERPLLKYRGELLYADYRGQYRMADGTPPIKGILTCTVSTDNGHTFKRRGTISADRTGESIRGEGCLAVTTDDRLVCVLRQQDQKVKPMKICWSSDQGRTWSESQDLCEFGVFPWVLRLGNGTMALSYGRPGVHLRFSPDGTGETWSEPIAIVEGSFDDPQGDSCGYTSLLALDDNSFLLAYNEMKYRNDDGSRCKAILVRRVTVRTQRSG